MTRALICAAAIALATLTGSPEPARAQGLSGQTATPFAGLTPGRHYSYVFVSSGAPMILLLAESGADGSVWDLIVSEDVNAQPYRANHYDAAGNVLRFVAPDGTVMSEYVPHNCERVLGLCEYDVTEGGETFREQRINGFANGAWSYSIFREDGESIVLKQVGSVTYDADGVTVSETWVTGAGDEDGVERIN